MFAIFAGTALVWVSLDRTPPKWDDAWYLANSLTVYDALVHRGIPGYLSRLNSVFGFKAPLIAALPTPFYLLFGRRWHAAYLVNIAAMAVLFTTLYRMASRWWSARAGVFAIAIAGTMPLLYGLARWYLVDYTLAALVAAAICILSESQSLGRRAQALLFGITCGFGLLLKAAFALFLTPAFLYVWIASRRRARSLRLSATPCLLLALPWYLGHLRPTLSNAFQAGFGADAAVQGTGAIFSVRSIATYLAHVAVSGVSLYYTVVTAVLIAIVAGGRAHKPEIPPLVFCWLLPFVIFLFGSNKDIRYIAPILPAFALLIASLLDAVLSTGKGGDAIGAFLVAVPMVAMFAVSFGVPYRANDLVYARRFRSESWSHDEILETIAARIPLQSGARRLLVVGSDRESFNANNIELTAVARQLPVDVETTAHEHDLNTLLDRVKQAAFFVYEEGGEPESRVFNPHIATLIQRVRNSEGFNELPYFRRLPDGGIVRLFEQTARSSSLPKPASEEFTIDFGGIVALTGESIAKTSDSATIQCRWRRARFDGREYWSFTHVIDPAGRIVAQHDQCLPTIESGSSGGQEIRIRLPAGASRSGLRLRAGIYDPVSGMRLKIGPLPAIAATRFTVSDQDTALIAPY